MLFPDFDIQPYSDASMRDRGGAVLVDERAGREAVEAERGGEWVRFVAGDRVGEDVAGAGGRLEPPGAPAAIQEKPADRQLADDRRSVRTYVDDPGPAPHHSQAREGRKQF